MNPLAWSESIQDGNEAPVEILSYTPSSAGYYQAAIYRSSGAVRNLHLYTYPFDFDEYVTSASLMVPADSPNAMAVGAVAWNTPASLESFSSRGPTKDGRTKPDVVAPDGVSTATYGAGGFYGTSAAAPHTAGAAALAKQLNPGYTPAQIQAFLESRAVELGTAGKDNLYGSGRLSMGTLPPAVTTSDASSIVFNSARLNGNLSSRGTASSVSVSFDYGTVSGNLPFATSTQAMSATGDFFADAGNLSANTRYYFRTKAIGDGTSYGAEKSFVTTQTVAPTVATDNATVVTSSSAQLNGTLTARGTATSANVSFEWGETTSYGNNTTLEVKANTGPFSATITGLSSNTTYHFRSRAVGHGGAVGEDKTLITAPGPTMEALVEPPGEYYRVAPVLSNLGFDDSLALGSGRYQLDGISSSNWTSLFPNVAGTFWDGDNWPIPSFGNLSEGSHQVFFKASNDAGTEVGGSGEWNWQFYKDTVVPSSISGLTSSSPGIGLWSSDNTVALNWNASTDNTSGILGYATAWDTTPSTDPGNTANTGNVTSLMSEELSSGNSTYFHIRAIDLAGNAGPPAHLGPFFIDSIMPAGPTSVNSTSHSPSTWSSNNTVTVSWTAATDNLSGLEGYLTLWDTNANGVPTGNHVGPSTTNVTSAPLTDNTTHYFHVRAIDAAGNNGDVKTAGPFWIDTAAPTGHAFGSSAPAVNIWSNNTTVTVSWTAATDTGSGLDGYGFTWDDSPSTNPSSKLLADNVTTKVNSATPDGTYYFHIRPIDKVGNWGTTIHVGPFLIETVTPSAIAANLTSTSHALNTWSNLTIVSVNWTAAVDNTSGIGGYSVTCDNSSDTIPPHAITSGNVTSANVTAPMDGSNLYVHVRAVDHAGNWSPDAAHLGPFAIETVAPTGPIDLKTSHAANAWSNNSTVTANWTAAADVTSGLAGYSVVWDTSAGTQPTVFNAGNTTTSNVTVLADGTSHYLHVRAKDNAGNWGVTATAGPFFIDVYSPVLSGGSVSPASGYQSGTYSFSVDYLHPQGLAPDSVRLSIDGGASINMTLNAGQSGNYTQNQTYSCNISGSVLAIGNHTFVFAATDNASQPALGDVGQNFGPAIQSPPSPPPSGGFGGGGGGGGGGAPAGPGVTAIGLYTNSEGVFNLAATVKSEDNNLSLGIAKGVIAKNKDGSALQSIKMAPVEGLLSPANGEFVGSQYECTPDGATFSPGIALTLVYDPAKLAQDIDIDSLTIAVLNVDKSLWEPLQSTHDKIAHSLTTTITHFSNYAIVGKIKAASSPPPPPAPAQLQHK